MYCWLLALLVPGTLLHCHLATFIYAEYKKADELSIQ